MKGKQNGLKYYISKSFPETSRFDFFFSHIFQNLRKGNFVILLFRVGKNHRFGKLNIVKTVIVRTLNSEYIFSILQKIFQNIRNFNFEKKKIELSLKMDF